MYDALLIPGGGLLPDGELPPWVRARFDLAISLYQNEFIIPRTYAERKSATLEI